MDYREAAEQMVEFPKIFLARLKANEAAKSPESAFLKNHPVRIAQVHVFGLTKIMAAEKRKTRYLLWYRYKKFESCALLHLFESIHRKNVPPKTWRVIVEIFTS